MKAERLHRVSISLYFEYAGVGTMLVDCFSRRFDTVIKTNTRCNSRELIIKYFSNENRVVYDVIIVRKSYVISIFKFLVGEKWRNCFQKLLSTFEHLSSKYLRMEFSRILITKFLRRLFSSQEDFPYFLKLFLAMFLRYWAFLRAEFIYGAGCDETVLLLTGAWWSTTCLMREVVYHAMSSMSSKIFITWNGAYSMSQRKSDSIKFL